MGDQRDSKAASQKERSHHSGLPKGEIEENHSDTELAEMEFLMRTFWTDFIVYTIVTLVSLAILVSDCLNSFPNLLLSIHTHREIKKIRLTVWGLNI